MTFKVPQRDLQFVLTELLDIEAHSAQLTDKEPVDRDLFGAIVDEASKFAENLLEPCYRTGDEEGCTHHADGSVTTPSGFKEAYAAYIEGGWPSLSAPTEFGGQNLPSVMHSLLSDITGTANWAWSMYPELSQGARHTIYDHGTDAQKELYLPKLISGEWTGTMCLTEPHCGTDLGMLRTKAEPIGDGTYKITGGKIFISSGDHDMAENIVHIVLAKLPGAAKGTKGISTFIVPKRVINEDGSLGDINHVGAGSIEHKMGIHGNATCALNFDGAIGYLLGDEDIGLKAMFTFMNLARLGTSFQGLAHCERGYQSAINYANERLQMRSLAGAKYPAMAADPIIVHPDVRRMVLHNKAMSEGLRAMLYRVSLTADLAAYGNDAAVRKAAAKRLALMTPITKAFATEQGIECASNAVQIMGGHGYIREWGVEQNLRDARIATIYEGTTGVQALDLLGRKVMADNGVELRRLLGEMLQSCDMSSHPMLAASLRREIEALQAVAEHVLAAALNNRDEIGAASVDFLMNCGYVIVAHEWLLMADLAQSKMGEGDDAFYQAKIDTARFYFAKVLPRSASLQACIYQGADTLMSHSALLTGDNL